MKAVILVGGYGTRLRPLTLTLPKPLVDFCNRPIIEHQIIALVNAGINHIILAVAYHSGAVQKFAQKISNEYGIQVTTSKENSPLDTAGPLTLIDDIKNEEYFIVMNSDVICRYPIKDMIVLSKKTLQAEVIMMVTKVSDASKFGVVEFIDGTQKITSFKEKPEISFPGWINGGIYVMRGNFLQRLSYGQRQSLERDLFPGLCEKELLYCYPHNDFWIDVGKPADFIYGTSLYLSNLERENAPKDSAILEGKGILEPVLSHSTAKIGNSCQIGPNVTIGSNCQIGQGCRLKNCILLEGVVLAPYSYISNSIIGWNCTVGYWSRIEGMTILGEDVHIGDECHIKGITVLPNKSVKESRTNSGEIIL